MRPLSCSVCEPTNGVRIRVRQKVCAAGGSAGRGNGGVVVVIGVADMVCEVFRLSVDGSFFSSKAVFTTVVPELCECSICSTSSISAFPSSLLRLRLLPRFTSSPPALASRSGELGFNFKSFNPFF